MYANHSWFSDGLFAGSEPASSQTKDDVIPDSYLSFLYLPCSARHRGRSYGKSLIGNYTVPLDREKEKKPDTH